MRRLSLLQERQAWRIGEVGAAIVALANYSQPEVHARLGELVVPP